MYRISGANVAASMQMYAISMADNCPCGLNHELCLSAHGRLVPGHYLCPDDCSTAVETVGIKTIIIKR
jgi:hypothetical protein